MEARYRITVVSKEGKVFDIKTFKRRFSTWLLKVLGLSNFSKTLVWLMMHNCLYFAAKI